MKKSFLSLCLIILISALAYSQTAPTAEIPYFSFGKGLGIASPDSMYLLNIRFRMQNRAAFTTESSSNLDISEVEARVRRLRLRFDGFVYNPKLTYVIQLSFSRSDQDFDDTGVPNVVRDAMMFYAFNKHFTLGLGQTKLPGNRQRVNSSGDLQLPDRSIVNTRFNIDRDFGVQAYYNNTIGDFAYLLRGSVTSGEGRNSNKSDQGLAYTGRVELLPFGTFTNGGDYFEGDLMREPKPKLSIGLTYSANQNATRVGGSIGKYIYEPRDITTHMADLLFKYKGFAFAAEWVDRVSNNPVTINASNDTAYVFTGFGQNFQSSYLFKNNFEIVGRFSQVLPQNIILSDDDSGRQDIKHYTIGVSKYLRGHRVKLQSDLTYETRRFPSFADYNVSNWQLRFQVELGI